MKTPAEIAKECETAFQNGGPKVYTLDSDQVIRASGFGAARTLRLSMPGHEVWARCKNGRVYEFKKVGVAK